MTGQDHHVHDATTRPVRRRRWRWIGADLAAASVALAVVTSVTGWLFELPAAYFVASGSLCLGLAVALWFFSSVAPSGLCGPGFGAANRVTLGRATLVLPVCALVVHPAVLSGAASWWVIGLSTIALLLDGVDGFVARRTGTATPFGARFDMELDAFLMLGLSMLVWLSGAVGAWVLLIGTLRYLFVLAGWIWPALRGELAPSRRRKTICVVEGIALLVCLGPVVPTIVIGPVAAGALALLVYSFVTDVWRLLRTRSVIIC